MRFDFSSIRARLILAAAIVLLAFMAVAGVALRSAHEESVRTAHYARLQSTIYLLLAGAEVDAAGMLTMPAEFAEPRLSLPGSGLYASVLNENQNEAWHSPSAVGLDLPFQQGVRVGEWRFETIPGAKGNPGYLAAAYSVKWTTRNASVPLVLSVLQDRQLFDREVNVFQRTLWSWLGGAGLLLLLSQTVLLQWGLSPLQRVANELSRIENGEQAQVQGRYPSEIEALTMSLNTLIKQERIRQTRYKEALSYLAHSLKTPLAVLRGALAQPEQLPDAVTQQVARMDDIVQHQLGRAAASGAARFAPYLALAPVMQRIQASLSKVYADKNLSLTVDCAVDLAWRIDEGDAFELIGNLMDNAAKWAKSRVVARAWREARELHLRIEDDGPGFSDTKAVLQLHVRMDEKVPGHGVGLAVVSDLVASHEGTLDLAASPWGGARVDVVLPMAGA